MEPYIVIAGGVNVDIGGFSNGVLREGDSNPGRVRLSAGGVGRNIAHNLVNLGVRAELLTAFGNDVMAATARRFCTEAGIGITHARTVPGGQTSSYLFLCDPDGEMKLAISDMSVCERITPDYLREKLPLINSAALLILDTNLPEASVKFLAENAAVPIFADPVSTVKAEKLRPVLGRLHTLKPNKMEASLLTGIPITDEESLVAAAYKLLYSGLKRVFISLGEGGVLAAERGKVLHLQAVKAAAVNVTGAGDAFMAALGWAYLRGLSLKEAASAGCAAAAFALESRETVSPLLNEAELLQRMKSEGHI